MSQPEIVNPVDVADLEPWLRGLLRGLLVDPYSHFAERVDQNRKIWSPERTWAARDGAQWVGTLATEERSMTVPGAGAANPDLPVDAVTGVTVAATHRRRGVLTAMLRNSLRAAKERGDAISVLIPAEWPIYGRFGYAPATQVATYRFHPRRRGAMPNVPATARVRHVEPAELRTAAPEVFAAARRRHAGQLDRRFPWWERALGLDGHRFVSDEAKTWVLHEGPGGPDGLVSWRTTHGWDIAGEFAGIRVGSLIAASDEAYRALWAYLAGIDLVGEIELTERPVDEPIRWLLTDGRALEQTAVVDFLWVRLLDVCAALAGRRYAVPGELVLDVVDDDAGGYGTGRVQLTAEHSQVHCARSQRPADLRLSQRALAASYLGGFRLRQRSVLGDVDELTPGAVQRFDAMFATAVPPWNQTWF